MPAMKTIPHYRGELLLLIILVLAVPVTQLFVQGQVYRHLTTRVFLMLILIMPAMLTAQDLQQHLLRFQSYTIEQGLSSDRVSSITQDHQGYIWVGTEGGLSRYDGYEFRVYRNIPGDFSSLSDSFIHVLFTDSHGDVWVGTRFGLNRFDDAADAFQRYYHDPAATGSLPHSAVHSIYESESGRLWIGTENGLAEYDRASDAFISEWVDGGSSVSLKGSTITTIAGGAEELLWIGTNNRGFAAFHPMDKSLRFLSEEDATAGRFPSRNISKIMVDSFGELWIGFLPDLDSGILREGMAPFGLLRYNVETGDVTKYSDVLDRDGGLWHLVSDIIEDSEKTIWVTTFWGDQFTGLNRFDREADRFFRYHHDPSNTSTLIWNYSNCVFEDRYRNLWVGTSRGISKVDLGRWQMGFMNVDASVRHSLMNNFYGIEELEEDLYWLALDGLGFIEWNRKENTLVHFGLDNPKAVLGSMRVIRKDHHGTIWLGSSGRGMVTYDSASGDVEYFTYNENDAGSLAGNYVTDVLVARDSTVWIATSNGLSRFNRNSRTFTNFRHETHSSWLTGNALNTLFEDSKGNIWIGTNRHTYDPTARNATGLIKWNPVTNQSRIFRNDTNDPESLSNDAIFAIAEDRYGDIWIGTNNGLNRYAADEDRFEVYLESHGLPSPVIIGMLFEDDGFLWLSTLNGLARLNPENGNIRVFSRADNVQGNRFNERSYFRNSRGELMFGGLAGLNYFDPSEISGTSVVPDMLITEIRINDEIVRGDRFVDEDGAISLNWSDNSLGFEYVAINFRSAELIRYEYKLTGFDSDWIRAGNRRYVNYTNLKPGRYEFRVRARNADDVWSVEDAVAAIRIHPPIWQTTGAYAFYFLLFAGVLLGVDLFQRRRLLRKERERTHEKELAQAREIEKAYRNLEEAHNKLESAHENLAVSHENLKTAQEQLVQQEKLASLGQLTAGIAHEIKNPLNFVNNFSDVSMEMIDEALEELKKIGEKEHSAEYSAGQAANNVAEHVVETAAILADIKSNLAKIHEHGTRADGIVKSMLMHSRGGSGKMEPTELNGLAKEYVNLAFHGMRAGKNPINVDIDLQLDESIGEVPMIAEDFSRVILNLCNNAFDAMRDKLAETGKQAGKAGGYKPKLAVRTRRIGDTDKSGAGNGGMIIKNGGSSGGILIEIEDTGSGIPDEFKDKILQPFFTTKKGTAGTGLGLSITHDIVKAHGGSIEVSSSEEGTAIHVQLKRNTAQQ